MKDIVEFSEIREKSFSNDSVTDYLQSFKRIRLTREEEISLAKRIEKGSTEAREEMIKSNLALVVSIAKKYTLTSVPLEDLIQEGTIGLIKAVDAFDYRRGCKLSTFATWWIKQSITRYIDNISRTIRIPVGMNIVIGRIKKEIDLFSDANGRKPDHDELSRLTGISTQKLNGYLAITKLNLLISMSDPVNNDDNSRIVEETVQDFTVLGPEESATRSESSQIIVQMLARLTPRQAEVVRLHFGLCGSPTTTLEDIGRNLHISRERVRQIEKKALLRLRSRYSED